MKKRNTPIFLLLTIWFFAFIFSETFSFMREIWKWFLLRHIGMLLAVVIIGLPVVIAIVMQIITQGKEFYPVVVERTVEVIIILGYITSVMALIKKKWSLAEFSK